MSRTGRLLGRLAEVLFRICVVCPELGLFELVFVARSRSGHARLSHVHPMAACTVRAEPRKST
jgi:hypothetical protein